MNSYKVMFFARCPRNNIRITYHLEIKNQTFVSVEDIVGFVDQFKDGFHEEIADQIFTEFGGHQILSADHHGVTITTTRGEA